MQRFFKERDTSLLKDSKLRVQKEIEMGLQIELGIQKFRTEYFEWRMKHKIDGKFPGIEYMWDIDAWKPDYQIDVQGTFGW